MKRLLILPAVFVLAACFATTRSVAVADVSEFPDFDVVRHLRVRHPELFRFEAFDSWSSKGREIGGWSERTLETEGGTSKLATVFVENVAESSLFAAKVVDGLNPVVTKFHIFDLKALPVTRQDAGRIVREAFPEVTIRNIAPIVTFGPGTLQWRVNVEGLAPRIIDIDQTGKMTEVPSVGPLPISAALPSADDSQLENDLHHFAVMKARAEKWISDAGIGNTDINGKAELICSKVNELIDYNCQNRTLCKFTLSDELIAKTIDPQTKKLAGACDEYAVLAVTALRAVGIGARVKLLWWKVGANQFAHAAVEFCGKNDKWIPMDPTYDRFNEASSYRKKDKVTDVIVVDARFPDDDVSQALFHDLPDPDGDGILHPYLDFTVPLVFAPQKPYSK